MNAGGIARGVVTRGCAGARARNQTATDPQRGRNN
jgi:hypothetical protein